MTILSEMELMIPINHPAYAGNTVFVSLYSNYLYLYKLLMENTSYFPYVNYYKNNIIYREIRRQNLTVDLTANQPIIPLINVPPHNLSKAIRKSPIPPDTTAIWVY
jgi:hypothetical protein